MGKRIKTRNGPKKKARKNGRRQRFGGKAQRCWRKGGLEKKPWTLKNKLGDHWERRLGIGKISQKGEGPKKAKKTHSNKNSRGHTAGEKANMRPREDLGEATTSGGREKTLGGQKKNLAPTKKGGAIVAGKKKKFGQHRPKSGGLSKRNGGGKTPSKKGVHTPRGAPHWGRKKNSPKGGS